MGGEKRMKVKSLASRRVVRTLITEPEAYNEDVRKQLPRDWDNHFLSIETEAELINVVSKKDYDIVFCRIGLPFNREFFRMSPCTSILATPTTGLDHIDLDEAENSGVCVLSLRGELELLRTITSTAEHAWALLLACNRRLPELVARTQNGSWIRTDMELHQLSGQTLGIIGLGRLGEMVADYANAFRMRIISYDTDCQKHGSRSDVEFVEIGQLLAESDHIVLTASYSSGDPEILTRNHVMRVKRGATFINVARGELVDESALVDAIDLGIIRAVGVDVLPGDSRWSGTDRVSSPLIDRSAVDNRILVTPHVGGYSREAVAKTRRFMIYSVDKVLSAWRRESR